MDTDRSVELSLTLLCVAAVLKVNCMKLKIVKVRFALLTSGSSSKRSIVLLASSSKSTCLALRCFALLGFALHCLHCFALLCLLVVVRAIRVVRVVAIGVAA